MAGHVVALSSAIAGSSVNFRRVKAAPHRHLSPLDARSRCCHSSRQRRARARHQQPVGAVADALSSRQVCSIAERLEDDHWGKPARRKRRCGQSRCDHLPAIRRWRGRLRDGRDDADDVALLQYPAALLAAQGRDARPRNLTSRGVVYEVWGKPAAASANRSRRDLACSVVSYLRADGVCCRRSAAIF